jgi:hypothetical protein
METPNHMIKRPLIYIAGPKTATKPDGSPNYFAETANIEIAVKVGHLIINLGGLPMLSHTAFGRFDRREMSEEEVILWRLARLDLLRRCDALVTVAGWQHDDMAKAELRACISQGKPFFHDLTSEDDQTAVFLKDWIGDWQNSVG